jgi:uncharacterized membrane-anchored protein YjiN (DUF445 family)
VSTETPPLRRPSWVDRIQKTSLLAVFEKYRQRMVHRETHLPFDPTRGGATPYTIERLAFETGWGLRLSLKLFLPGCLLLFLVSLFWDFHGLLLACSVAGAIGFGTNWVAIKMLFWPRQTRPIFGQGLIPAQRDQLIDKVANEVLEKLINEELIFRKIEETRVVQRFSEALIAKLRQVARDPEFRGDVRAIVLTYTGELVANPDFREGLARRAEAGIEEFAGTDLRAWFVKKLKDVWRPSIVEVLNQELERLDQTVDEALTHLDDVVDRLPRALEARQVEIDRVLTAMILGIVREVDVRAIVLEQLSTVTAEELERGFREFSDDKLSFITILGGILGVIGGPVLIWPLPTLGVLFTLGVVLLLADVLAQPLMKSRYWPRRKAAAAPPSPSGAEPAPPT